MLRILVITSILLFSLTACQQTRSLSQFKTPPTNTPQTCFDRQTQPHTFVVDSHVHFRPYGNNAIDYQKLTSFFQKAGVLFVNVYGIGQILPQDGQCQYPANCPNTPVTPNVINDQINIENAQKYPNPAIHLTHAMTFADLSQPQPILEQMQTLQQKYHHKFKWMGELNLVKQGLFSHGHQAVTTEQIDQWQPFMQQLQQQNIPLALHADIGSDSKKLEYLPKLDHVLSNYSNNKLVWLHLGLSPEQTQLSADQHLSILQQRLDQYPNLYLDISWRILNKQYHRDIDSRQKYVEFLNQNYQRILTGSDFVATDKHNFRDYKNSVLANSEILKSVDNRAFRSIVLGQNYFDLLQLNYRAPPICQKP